MENRTSQLFAFADVHGQFDTLQAVLSELKSTYHLKEEEDTLVFLGDYVDGGPKTKQVIDWCIDSSKKYPHWVFLKGNHEQLLIEAVGVPPISDTFQLWWRQGGRATYLSYAAQDITSLKYPQRSPSEVIPIEHREWMRNRPLMHETEHFLFAHAGMRPRVHKADQTEHDLLWIRDEFFTSGYDFGKPVIYGHTTRNKPFVNFVGNPEIESPILLNGAHKISSIGLDTMGRRGGDYTCANLTDPNDIMYITQEPIHN